MKNISLYICAKCKNDVTNGAMFFNGKIGYFFCKECTNCLGDQTTSDIISNFVGSVQRDKI